jgi:hypothetical protein
MLYHRRPRRPRKIVVAQEFHLVNANGASRALLYVDPKSDQPILCLYDKDSNESRVELAISPEGDPALDLFDRDGRKRMSLGLWEDDPTVSLYDSEHEYPRVSLIAIDGHTAQVCLSDGEYVDVRLFAGRNSIETPAAQAGIVLRDNKDGSERCWLIPQDEPDAESSGP